MTVRIDDAEWLISELKAAYATIDRQRNFIIRMQAACGIPDASEACRQVIRLGSECLASLEVTRD